MHKQTSWWMRGLCTSALSSEIFLSTTEIKIKMENTGSPWVKNTQFTDKLYLWLGCLLLKMGGGSSSWQTIEVLQCFHELGNLCSFSVSWKRYMASVVCWFKERECCQSCLVIACLFISTSCNLHTNLR